jgi:hypothetical protein
MTKHLSSEITNVSYIFIKGDQPTFVQTEVTSSPILLSDIAKSVYQVPTLALEKSVIEGMRVPIIVVENSYTEWRKATDGLSNALSYNPNKKFLCIIGNQRMVIAENNDYDSIEAFKVSTGIEAIYVKKAYDNMEEYEDLLVDDAYLKAMDLVGNYLKNKEEITTHASAIISAAVSCMTDAGIDEITIEAILETI